MTVALTKFGPETETTSPTSGCQFLIRNPPSLGKVALHFDAHTVYPGQQGTISHCVIANKTS